MTEPTTGHSALLRGSEVGELTPRQWLFVDAYMKEPNATRAARVAGYKSPPKAGPRLIDPNLYPHVCRIIVQRMEAKSKQAGIEAVRLVQELMAIGLMDIRCMFDASGAMLPLNQMPEHATRSIKKLKVRVRHESDDDGNIVSTTESIEVDLHDKLGALRQIAEHCGWLKDENRAGDVNTTNNTVVINLHELSQLPRRAITDVVQQRIHMNGHQEKVGPADVQKGTTEVDDEE